MPDEYNNPLPQAPTNTEVEIPEEQPSSGSFWGKKVINFLKLILAFFLTAVAVYIILTAPAYWSKIQYYFAHRNDTTQPEFALPKNSQTTVYLPDVQNNTNEPANTAKKLTLADLENNYLIIPKLDIKVPIVWGSDPDEKIMLENLQKGVVHYGSTPLPDSGKGPVFITGHSSYYWWDKGLYKTIFANLDQLDSNDEIALAYNNIVYIYKVFDKIVVSPTQTEVLDQVNEPILDLMTCVPIGTNLNRLIIKARQISPTKTIKETIKSTPSTQGGTSSDSPKYLGPTDGLELLPWNN